MLQPLLKRAVSFGATFLLAGACAASAAQTTFRFTVTVTGTCEVQAQDTAGVTLRCTKGFSPVDPHTVSQLVGHLPAQPLTLVATQPAPNGGTLNTYAVSAAQTPDATPPGLIAFY